ncbi:MAG: NAD(P)/FAD-dependent oxidoreductase [Alphaproteobacteria bacterium]|nr:NAD(P)/FAD-dependent oxidoreductase [Alphaproteobacteria bacterium]
MKHYDVIIIGAGAAGLAAAAQATARDRYVCVLDMGGAPARKVLASGGGRCNFTNAAAASDRYFGRNPNFVRGALARVKPADILEWAAGHGIKWTEKTPGQFFCTTGATDIVNALITDAKGADIILGQTVENVTHSGGRFHISCPGHEYSSDSLIVATGGISFATYGVSDAGYKIAKGFGHSIIPPRPALCAIDANKFPREWAGISIFAQIKIGKRQVCGDMLFTHFGIGGPVVYSASVAGPECDININLMPNMDLAEWLRSVKKSDGRKSLHTILAMRMPMQMARYFSNDTRNIADIRDSELADIARQITDIIIPADQWRHHGMAAAEVTYGGVDTSQISSKTMESKIIPGLYFAGEVMDVTGDLGGFNLQWAWASGRVAGQNA